MIMFPGIHISFLCTLTVLRDWFHDLIKCFLCRNLTSRIALGWRIRMTNHLLQYYLKRNAFYKVSYSPMEYTPGLYCTVVLSFIYCYSFVRHAYHHLDEKHSILSENFGYYPCLIVHVVCVYHMCACIPQSGTILFFSHFYMWSNWIDKVRECDNFTCCVFTPHSALILD